MTSDALLASLHAAVDAMPDDLVLRLHLAEVLSSSGARDEAVRQAAIILQRDPDNPGAYDVITSGTGWPEAPETSHAPVAHPPAVLAAYPAPAAQAAHAVPAAHAAPAANSARPSDEDTLRRLDAELTELAPPMYADDGAAAEPDYRSFDLQEAGVRLSDVGGMEEVKARLEAGILAPLRNPELVRLYGKSLRGGMLLYGPPGCGKTFIARAVAGEMGARFLAVGLADVLDMYIGQSERNIREIFAAARRAAPCVLFFDEVDALGQKRTQLRNSAARGTVNQLLAEMDGVANSNDGVFVLGATNHPWDVDVALRRPGRFDRTVLVLPPDDAAREAILRYHLRSRPIANVDVRKLARLTDGYSGADLAYICELGAERALLDSARTGVVRMIEMGDLEGAAKEVRPSIGPWLDTAKNVAQFANEGGTYDDLLTYLRKRRIV